MKPTYYKIRDIGDGFLAVMAKPIAGEWVDEEFDGLSKAGIRQVVSLLEDHESREVGLADERTLCEQSLMRFVSFPIADRGLPSNIDTFAQITARTCDEIARGLSTVVHCRAGIGRTGLFAAAMLMQLGVEVDEASALVSECRGGGVPDTDEQREWLRSNRNTITDLNVCLDY